MLFAIIPLFLTEKNEIFINKKEFKIYKRKIVLKIKMSNSKTNTTTITKIALFSALQCIISPFAIVFPFSPVPLSLATLMLYLSPYILGKKNSVISCGIYLLIGLVGLPVFSGFTGGIGKVLGPTGGYMLGYLFLVYISGWFVEKWNDGSSGKMAAGRSNDSRSMEKHYCNYLMQGLGMFFGTAVCYLFGSLWLSFQSGTEFLAALTIGVIPFIPGDVVKLFIGIMVGNVIKRRLARAGVL